MSSIKFLYASVILCSSFWLQIYLTNMTNYSRVWPVRMKLDDKARLSEISIRKKRYVNK